MKALVFILIVIALVFLNYMIVKKVQNKIVKTIPCAICLILSITCFIAIFGMENSLGISKGLTIFFVGIFSSVAFIVFLITLIYDFRQEKNKKTSI